MFFCTLCCVLYFPLCYILVKCFGVLLQGVKKERCTEPQRGTCGSQCMLHTAKRRTKQSDFSILKILYNWPDWSQSESYIKILKMQNWNNEPCKNVWNAHLFTIKNRFFLRWRSCCISPPFVCAGWWQWSKGIRWHQPLKGRRTHETREVNATQRHCSPHNFST